MGTVRTISLQKTTYLILHLGQEVKTFILTSTSIRPRIAPSAEKKQGGIGNETLSAYGFAPCPPLLQRRPK